MTTTLDERGRVLIPKHLRDHLGLGTGAPVEVLEQDGEIVIRKVLQRREAFRRLIGAIHDGNRLQDVERIDPLETKRLWEPRV